MIDFPKDKITQLIDFMESKLVELKISCDLLANTSFVSDVYHGLKFRNIDFASLIITNGNLITEDMVKISLWIGKLMIFR